MTDATRPEAIHAADRPANHFLVGNKCGYYYKLLTMVQKTLYTVTSSIIARAAKLAEGGAPEKYANSLVDQGWRSWVNNKCR